MCGKQQNGSLNIRLRAPHPVIHGRRGLTYTELDKTTKISEVQEAQFRSYPEGGEFDNFYRQVRREVTAYLQLHPVH
jgi:hypothetical protein